MSAVFYAMSLTSMWNILYSCLPFYTIPHYSTYGIPFWSLRHKAVPDNSMWNIPIVMFSTALCALAFNVQYTKRMSFSSRFNVPFKVMHAHSLLARPCCASTFTCKNTLPWTWVLRGVCVRWTQAWLSPHMYELLDKSIYLYRPTLLTSGEILITEKVQVMVLGHDASLTAIHPYAPHLTSDVLAECLSLKQDVRRHKRTLYIC